MSQFYPAEQAEYRCPGQNYAISPAVHLGRLARAFPLCRDCPHREETGSLSPRLLGKLRQTWTRPPQAAALAGEGVSGICPQALPPEVVCKMGAALGIVLRQAEPAAEAPLAAVGGDGRLLTAELLAAAAEGLRWSGCQVVELGTVHAGLMAFAIEHLQMAGGIRVGNPLGGPHTAGLLNPALPMDAGRDVREANSARRAGICGEHGSLAASASIRFYAGGPRPLSAGSGLERIAELAAAPLDRPTRRYGRSRRFDPREPYLDTLREFYHALRPLRWVLSTACPGVRDCLQSLAADVACEILPATRPADLPGRILAERAHFGLEIADDGQVARVWDERGQVVPPERLLILLARQLLVEQPQGAIVLEPNAQPPELMRAIEQLGSRAIVAESSWCGAMDEALRTPGAILGGGGSGRIWHVVGYPSADAVRTVSRLLVLLSRSDRRLSEVLDAEAAAG